MLSFDRVVFDPCSGDDEPLTVEFRWGIKESDLPAIRSLHESSFPLKFENEYYNMLVSDFCSAIVAFIQPVNELHSANRDSTAPTADAALAAFTVPVGFCIGQLAHARARDGSLDEAPGGYIGALAVDAILRCRGLGDALLSRFLRFMFTQVSVPASAFLDMSSAEQKGVPEVWLHCLAEDKKLVRFYCKRGFSELLWVPALYNFNDTHHDGLLLVCRANKYFSYLLNYNRTHMGAVGNVHGDPFCVGAADASGGVFGNVSGIELSINFDGLREEWQRRQSSFGFGEIVERAINCGWRVKCFLLVTVSAWILSTGIV